jgi:hypothetical protein
MVDRRVVSELCNSDTTNRREKSGSEQLAELLCIHLVVLVACFQQRVLPRVTHHHLGNVGFE